MSRAMLALVTVGCGALGPLGQDRCEALCRGVGNALSVGCDAFQWEDFGASNRTEFVSQCQDDWGRERNDLTASDLRRALDQCQVALDALEDMDCQDYLTLIGPQL